MAEKQKKKPNWIKIRTEYETSDISYRKLADKHSVSFNTLKDRAIRELWKKRKEESHNEIATKTQQKAREKISDKNAYDITTELEATNLINKLVLDTLKDTNQFKKHLVTRKWAESTAGCGSESRQWVEEKEFSVVDTKRLQALTASLETASKLKRLLCDIVDEATRQKQELEKQKQEKEEKQDSNIVVKLEGDLEGWSG